LSSLSAANRLNGPKESTSMGREIRRSFIRVNRTLMSASDIRLEQRSSPGSAREPSTFVALQRIFCPAAESCTHMLQYNQDWREKAHTGMMKATTTLETTPTECVDAIVQMLRAARSNLSDRFDKCAAWQAHGGGRDNKAEMRTRRRPVLQHAHQTPAGDRRLTRASMTQQGASRI